MPQSKCAHDYFYLIKVIIFTFSLIITQYAHAFSFYSLRNSSIPEGLDKLVNRVDPSLRVGIVVQSMRDGHIYYARNANQFFAPASVQKLFTVASALVNLSPNYRFSTKLLIDGTLNQGVLNGNVIFQFNGDPTLTQSTINEFIRKLAQMGVHQITGSVIIDDTAYDHASYPPGWFLKDLSFDFAAPLNTVIINRNRFAVMLVPGRYPGMKPQIISLLPPGTATFINDIITTRYPRWSCPIIFESNEKNHYEFHGCLSHSQGVQHRALAIRNMQLFTKNLINELFAKNHIYFKGETYVGKGPTTAAVVAEHLSKPLSHIIIHLLKKSDNLYADALLKKLGQHYEHAEGGWKSGVQAILGMLEHYVGINTNACRFHDGAGLSQYDAITPYSISQLLYYVYHTPMLRDSLIPALPIAGVDGTLAGRMPDLAHGRLLRAKTGSMGGVSTLAGYVQSRHHGLLSFVIMINNVPKNRGPSIWLENHIGDFLARA